MQALEQVVSRSFGERQKCDGEKNQRTNLARGASKMNKWPGIHDHSSDMRNQLLENN